MKTTEEILEILKQNFPDDVKDLVTVPVESYINCNPLAIDMICLFLIDNPDLLMDNMMNLSGVDDANGTNLTDESGSLVIQGGTLSVYYHLESTTHRHKVVLKVSTERENPQVNSVSDVWRSADWHEREAYDLFGINFINHPDLRRILMPYDWEFGYPLRKDYKNPEFYQGMKVPY